MNYRLRAWHVLLAGPVVEFLVGLAVLVNSPTVRDAGFVGNRGAVGLALHGLIVMTVAIFAGMGAVVPLVLFALGRLQRVAALLSAGLAVVFGVLPPEPNPGTWAAAFVFALAAVLGWREAGERADGEADERPVGGG